MVSCAPGQTVTPYENSLRDVGNRFWYIFATNADRTYTWSGPIEVFVTNKAFNHCLNIGTTDSWIAGYMQIDVGHDVSDATFRLD